jgi:lipopolysaccharide export system protein LptC
MTTATGDAPFIRRPKPPHLQRRARVVAVMRLILPATAALLLAMLALWSRFGLDTTSFRLSMDSIDLNNLDTLAMSNAHFEGMDDKNRPFSISAEKATQVTQDADTIDLTQLQADMTMTDGAWLSLISDSGRLQRSKQLLDLLGQVNLFQDQGYELHTRDVNVDLARNSAIGHNPVQGQGPSGEVTAEGVLVLNSGARIVFLGHTHIVFYGDSQMSAVPKP